MELTNSIRKMVASLDDVKHRRRENAFKAEGTKCILDTYGAFRLRHLLCTDAWWQSHAGNFPGVDSVICTSRDLDRMTHLSTAPEAIAVYDIPEERSIETGKGLILALDGVQDPGNLGTIIRIADWFGIRNIMCSRNTVDLYSPKVIMATMGAIARVNVVYCDLYENLAGVSVPVYGTFLDGENIFKSQLDPCGIIVMGNEGRGISPQVSDAVTHRIHIPSYPPGSPTSESLNVGMATAITVAEFRRRQLI